MMYDIAWLKEHDSSIVENICGVFSCDEDDIDGIEPVKAGLTNFSFGFFCRGRHYVYRCPGKGTEHFINRKSEAYAETEAKRLGLDKCLVAIDPETGWKISRYIEGYVYIDPDGAEDRALAMAALKKLHSKGKLSELDFDYALQSERIRKLPDFSENIDFSPYEKIHSQMLALSDRLENKGYKKVLCHNDAWHLNMLKDLFGEVNLIDWEYAGNCYPAADVAYFTAGMNCDDEGYIALAELYEGRKITEEEKSYYFSVMALVFWYWFVWALYEEYLGTEIEDKQAWFEKAVHALDVVQKN